MFNNANQKKKKIIPTKRKNKKIAPRIQAVVLGLNETYLRNIRFTDLVGTLLVNPVPLALAYILCNQVATMICSSYFPSHKCAQFRTQVI